MAIIFWNFSPKVFENLLSSLFWIPKICYQVLRSARGCIYTSCSGSFIQTFTTRWKVTMVLPFHMKEILILVRTVFLEFIRWFEDYQLPICQPYLMDQIQFPPLFWLSLPFLKMWCPNVHFWTRIEFFNVVKCGWGTGGAVSSRSP